MNELINTNNLTMSSLEIAELTNKRHDTVRISIERLANNQIIQLPSLTENVGAQGHKTKVYLLQKRDTYVVVAQLSPEFTGALVDRWQELENQQKPKTPQTYLEALEELVVITKEKERLQSLNNALCHVTKTYISSELAKEIGFKSAKELNKKLHEKGIQFKQNDTWLPYAKYSNLGLYDIKQGITSNGHVYYNSQFTQKGRQFVLALFGAE